MSFKFSERHTEEFYNNGLTVFRGILPSSLITDLRRVTDEGRAIVRSNRGGQALRFQPVSAFDIDQRPFQDYAELPVLQDAICQLLSPDHRYGFLDFMGVLIEPSDLPYCMSWHRDARNILDDDEWEQNLKRFDFGNQVNCALYDDSCTWFVPGSHTRDDSEGEKAVGGAPGLEGKNADEREQLCLEYCESMPGAQQLILNAGDFALYRPWAWHLGNYHPSRKRATLHEAVATPEAQEEWIQRMKAGRRVAAV